MNKFHVLLVDDSLELIQRLASRISERHDINGTTWWVDFQSVHIQVEHEGDRVHFTDETLHKLVAACRNRPDLILADYGFSSPEQGKRLYSGELTPAQYLERIL